SCNPGNSLMQKIMALFKAPRSIGSYYPMGIVLGFLPCGLTYTALLAAARAAMEAHHPFAGMLQGSLMMMLFGIGTAPALILVGKMVNTISNKTRKWFYRVASLIMIATGVWFVVSGW
ncbi:MAG: sulfite exporter TauE/SafE family protein, partial [Desulfobulbaceae bacterium]|nr:sulfite exporter TauE/SafE family protein [Desulfobulbaceae bacterium]